MAANKSTTATTTTATSTFTEDLVFLEGQEEAIDLSYWEFVNPSDADDSDSESLHSIENGFVSWYSVNTSTNLSPGKTQISNAHQSQDLVVDDHDHDHHDDGYDYFHQFNVKTGTFLDFENTHQVTSLVDDDNHDDFDGGHEYYHQNHVKPAAFFHNMVYNQFNYDVDDDEEEEEEEEEEGDEYDEYDDELVPWHLTGKLGRQRMRKLGKRVFAKMGSTRHNAHRFVKPGCVRGKHGLGIKA